MLIVFTFFPFSQDFNFPFVGLCLRCSEKLNYGHKRREVSKELKKLRDEVDMIQGKPVQQTNAIFNAASCNMYTSLTHSL